MVNVLLLLAIGGLTLLYLLSQGIIKLSFLPLQQASLPTAYGYPSVPPLNMFTATALLAPAQTTPITDSSSPPHLPLTQLPSSASGIPSASTIYNSETLMLPPSVKGVIIFLPNEAHELTPKQRIGEKNGEFLPLNVVIGAGASVAVLNGDAGHTHTISIGEKGDSSTPYTGTALFPGLTAGSYDIVAGGVVRHDKVTVSPTPASGSTTVGLIYVPTELVPKFKSAFAAAGFSVLSEFNYSKKVGRINENTVLVYSTNQDIQMAVQKLPAIAMMNTYT